MEILRDLAHPPSLVPTPTRLTTACAHLPDFIVCIGSSAENFNPDVLLFAMPSRAADPHRTHPHHLSRRELLVLGTSVAAGCITRRVFAGAAGTQNSAPQATSSNGPLAPIVPVELSTPDGRLRGQLLPDGIRRFRGIRFAEPPTGDLRFQPPVAVRPWTGVRDALNFGPAAMQPGDNGVAHSEDCLFLNVWTPALPGPHPVFLWIHGGGYTGGNSFAPVFDGVSFAREHIVLVTVAYRLGAFGFLDFGPLLGPAYNASANNGTRDVLQSLRWVQRNIAAFGGDPARVTIGGESAGAKLTATLMALPEAEPLFQSAISESGGGERILTSQQAVEVAQRFADQYRQLSPGQTGGRRETPASVAPGVQSSSAPLASLRAAGSQDLLAAQERTIAASPLHFPFRPEIDGNFLRGRPVDLVAQGSARGKRLLIGTNRDESALFLGPHPAADPTSRDLGNLSVERFNAVCHRYAALYPDMPADLRRIRAVSAEEYWVPSVRLADAQSRNAGPTWMYRLDFAPTAGRFAGESAHAADIDLVWNQPYVAARRGPEHSPDNLADAGTVPLAAQMHAAWCAFIRGEAPAAPGLPAWPNYNPDTRPTMLLDRTSRIENQPAEAELRLWDGVL